MRIALLTGWLSENGGGVLEAVFRMAQSLRAMPELELSILGLDHKESAPARDWKGMSVAALPTRGPSSWGYAPDLARRLAQTMPDLLHVHGLWMFPSVASRRWSRATRRPYVVTPHGMLDPWAVRNSRWKKSAALWAYEMGHLQGAACLHALCDAEAEGMRGFGLRNPICIVPNSIDMPDIPDGRTIVDPGREISGQTLLYLGRLHPKKGLISLLNAWYRFRGRRGLGGSWDLVIAGWDQGGHEKDLRNLANRLGIAESVLFLGPTFGTEKVSLFKRASAFVLPSMSEGLPMVVLEAWSYGLPVLMTPQCNFPERFAAHAAIYIEANAASVLDGLNRLEKMTGTERRKMGAHGLDLCREHFCPGPIAEKMTAVYRWLAGRGPKPSVVYND
jgi:glycosyltransferase involved in cell wall biosynthesis